MSAASVSLGFPARPPAVTNVSAPMTTASGNRAISATLSAAAFPPAPGTPSSLATSLATTSKQTTCQRSLRRGEPIRV